MVRKRWVTITDLAVSIAKCDPGDTAVSGSYMVTIPGNARFIDDNALSNHTGWIVTADSAAGPPVRVTASVECFDNPPLR